MKAMLKAFVLAILFTNSIFAQLDNGTIYPKNIEGIDVLTNQAINVQDWLDQGKPVIVNFFTSWSKQSWEYYETNWLNDLNAEFGPNGSDEIRIIAIEGEPLNGPEQLSMEVSGVRPHKSYGDWTQMVSFPILDDDQFNSAFNADLFPITYIIRPNGALIELNRNNALLDRDFHIKALFPKQKDIIVQSNIRDASFCGDHEIPESQVTVLNMGEDPIENLILEFFVGSSVVQTHNIAESISPLSVGLIETDEQLINGNSDVNIFVSNINNSTYPIDQYNIITAEIREPVLDTEKLIMEITFDQYPNEAQWILETDSGEEIARENYTSSNIEPWSTIEYEINVPTDINCLNLILQDNYGDGWTKWGKDEDGNNTPVPGIRFFNQYGKLLKDKHNVENSTNFNVDFESLDVYLRRDALSSDDEAVASSDIKLYPIPASNLINVENLQELSQVKGISLTNLLGQTIKNFSNNSISTIYDISELNKGIYYFNIETKNEIISKLFVKE